MSATSLSLLEVKALADRLLTGQAMAHHLLQLKDAGTPLSVALAATAGKFHTTTLDVRLAVKEYQLFLDEANAAGLVKS